MKIKLLLTILLLAETITANAQNAEKEYLKKVLTGFLKQCSMEKRCERHEKTYG